MDLVHKVPLFVGFLAVVGWIFWGTGELKKRDKTNGEAISSPDGGAGPPITAPILGASKANQVVAPMASSVQQNIAPIGNLYNGPVTVYNGPVTNEAAQKEFIPDTIFLDSRLREVFPYGYIIFSFEDIVQRTPRGDAVKWEIPTDSLRITPDFNKGTVNWDIQGIKVNGNGFRDVKINLRQGVPLNVGEVFYLNGIELEGIPNLHVVSLNDRQKHFVCVLGLRTAAAKRFPL